jgi:hypothetical protein
VLFLGRGAMFPLAMEGALKLKEISYIHAEGYAAGELKHGPIALVDELTPIVALAPLDEVFEKTASNLQEVAARGGPVIMIAPKSAPETARRRHPPRRCAGRAIRLIAPLVYAVAGAAAGLLHRGPEGHRRRPAAQSGQVGHGGVIASTDANALGCPTLLDQEHFMPVSIPAASARPFCPSPASAPGCCPAPRPRPRNC